MNPIHNLYSVSQIRELDEYAVDQYALPSILLMKRAGKRIFEVLMKSWPTTDFVEVFCGSGNNAGDGYVLAALAAQRGLFARVWQLSDQLEGAALLAFKYAQQEGVVIEPFNRKSWSTRDTSSTEKSVIIDALLGIGFKGGLRQSFVEAVEQINDSGMPVISVDVPTGVNAENGRVLSHAVKADLTLSFIGQKLGNLIGDGRLFSGKRFFDDLSLPAELYTKIAIEPKARVLDLDFHLSLLKPRKLDAHKGDFGYLMVVGGDHGYGGAPLMSAQMAARSGAGLVGVVTQVSNTSAINARQPELMTVGISSGQEFLPHIKKPKVIVVGPGLGQTSWSEQMLYQCLHAAKPMVVDADALNILSQSRLALPKLKNGDQRQWILTPHPGEAARLLTCTTEQVQNDRISAIYSLQEKFGGVIVLKGAGTLVLTSKKELFVCDAGNPSMASGGMGDVLSGLLGALMSQGLSIDFAACLGTSLHSKAADIAVAEKGPYGLLATDLIDYVRTLLNSQAKK